MKIYTKAGDQGETGLYGGSRIHKSSSYIEAYGTVDELNSWMGFCASPCKEQKFRQQLIQVQHDLHLVGADLATPQDTKVKITRLSSERALRLEREIDLWQNQLTPLQQFILPGGGELSSRLHIARTVCRRAEREVVQHQMNFEVNAEVIRYLNRLSDWLFVAARWAQHESGEPEILWDQSR